MSYLAVFAALPAAEIPLAMILPFGLLLLLIAVMPLTPGRVKQAWERFYPHVAVSLGAGVVIFYLLRVPGGGEVVVHTGREYFSFICLIASLFVVAGGIHLTVKGEATPLGNAVFLAIGAVMANFVGTTGASMVLIRPYIRMNRIRASGYHIVFFIFVISNVGGALTPIGDPPLFLGYLRGVPFFWLVEHVMLAWLATLGALLAVFYLVDRHHFTRLPKAVRREVEVPDTWQFSGGINVLLLLVIIGAVFLPGRFLLRELTMIAAAAASYFMTPKAVHRLNAFGFAPIKEVAFLFLGIFATMMPALGYLSTHGQNLGFKHAAEYYFATGTLSSVLDNAPTYLNFLQLARVSAVADAPEPFSGAMENERAQMEVLLDRFPELVIAVSLGAVFFGAMTYIGNGPNFMVKSIAENAHVQVPSFFGYIIRYSLPILLPILALTGWLFL